RFPAPLRSRRCWPSQTPAASVSTSRRAGGAAPAAVRCAGAWTSPTSTARSSAATASYSTPSWRPARSYRRSAAPAPPSWPPGEPNGMARGRIVPEPPGPIDTPHPGPRVVAIVPALDEEAAIARLVPEFPREVVAEVIVVDNGSRDATASVAQAAGARVVAEPRRGYGRACLAGLLAARGADVVVYLDGDYSDDPGQIPRLLAPLLRGQADLVVGTRGPGVALPPHQRLGNALAMRLLRLLFGVRLADPGSFRVARRDLL